MFLIIDGHNLAHRGFNAQKTKPGGLRVCPQGRSIAACVTVLNSLIKLMREYNPSRVAVVFDGTHKTFRHELWADYKAERKPKDPRLLDDISRLVALLTKAGIGIVAPEPYEADDLMGTLATLSPEPVLIYTNDCDLLQLVTNSVHVLYPAQRGNPAVEIAPELVTAYAKVPAGQIIDLKALAGDSSDNIPGIQKVGEGIALPLLQKYGTVESIYENIRFITGTPYRRIKGDNPGAQAIALLSKKLATIVTDVPVREHAVEQFRLENFNVDAILSELEALGLKDLGQKLDTYLAERLF